MSVKVKVIFQGDAVPGKLGYLLKKSKNIAAFYLDGAGKTGRIYPYGTGTSCFIDDKVYNYPSMTIGDGEDDSQLSEICFPEYSGWRIHCVGGGKTMAVCLVKED
jgi:hypothetical protein